MKSKLNKKTLIWCKVYIDRAKMYLGYINFLMIGIVFLHTFKDESWIHYLSANYYITYPLIIIGTILLFLFIGYVDTKFGLRQEELKNISNSNPIIQEILNHLKELKIEKESLKL